MWVSWGLYLSFADHLQYPLLSSSWCVSRELARRSEAWVSSQCGIKPPYMCALLCACSFCIHPLIWTSRPWLKEQVGRACGSSLPFQRRKVRYSSVHWLAQITQWQSQQWNLIACTNHATATINPELLVVAASYCEHSDHLLEKCWCLIPRANMLLCMPGMPFSGFFTW